MPLVPAVLELQVIIAKQPVLHHGSRNRKAGHPAFFGIQRADSRPKPPIVGFLVVDVAGNGLEADLVIGGFDLLDLRQCAGTACGRDCKDYRFTDLHLSLPIVE
ncbi:hypothetical protein D3C81_1418610 [compost metagenome]